MEKRPFQNSNKSPEQRGSLIPFTLSGKGINEYFLILIKPSHLKF